MSPRRSVVSVCRRRVTFRAPEHRHLIAAAVGVSWFAPTGTTSTKPVCVYYGGQLTAEVAGPSVAI
jgi:hypothetical protein